MTQDASLASQLRRLLLPSAIGAFERKYLMRMIRVALWTIAAHVPAMMAVAALAGTGVLKAFCFTTFVLFGPVLAARTLENPRHVTRVIGIAAMCLAGLLVYFGQGAMQIEMHFYFFVLLALLVVFADPLVIVLAAASVAAHHLLLFFLLPASVFNYEATLWTVVVHVAFVVVESLAASFVARNFYESVIGLEHKVQERTTQLEERGAELRMMLDTVGQGFLTVDRQGIVLGERSKILDRWLPPCPPRAFLGEYLGVGQPRVLRMFRLGWAEILEDVMPLELCLDQLPKRIEVSGRPLAIEYQPVLEAGQLSKVVVVLSDMSVDDERRRVEEENADLLAVCERIVHDREGFRVFLGEADMLVPQLRSSEQDAVTTRRLVHTLKGNSALFGLGAIARLCHAYEEAMEEGPVAEAAARTALLQRWVEVRGTLVSLFGTHDAATFEITEADYDTMRSAMAAGDGAAALQALERVRLEPVATRFVRLAEQAQILAERLGKCPVRVEVDAADVRLERARWAPLWSALVHAVNNSVDHGLETQTERDATAKNGTAALTFRATQSPETLVLELADDGRGIDWEALRERAAQEGLPHDTPDELDAALFSTGVSTKQEATTVSGRGVGLGALRSVVRRLGGRVDVHSVRGEGTRIQLRFPAPGKLA